MVSPLGLTLLLLQAPEPVHWAYAPLRDPAQPEVRDASWGRNSIDAFVLRRLEDAGLEPAPEADPAALLRRVTLDLTGLPPSLEEQEAFLADPSDAAYAGVVERLLASPAYGERWARHWLDVARYGDSNGVDENHALPHAHQYRNWVIDALNRDLPYDRFVLEQLAGDLLPPSEDPDVQADRLRATGFLAIGSKILAEQDEVKRRMDFVDEQIDTFSKAFLGLTAACARCHDHKYDPIGIDEYYALAGIFHSTDTVDRPLETSEFLEARALARAELQANEEQERRVLHEATAPLLAELGERGDAYREAAAEAVRFQRLVDPARPRAGDLAPEALRAAPFWSEAEDFDRGNVVPDHDHYGAGIGIISDPGGQDNFAEYDLSLAAGGTFRVELRYAAAQPRPGQVSVDGVRLDGDDLGTVTGGWMPEHQAWHLAGEVTLEAGAHVLRLESSPMMVHIDQVVLLPVDTTARLEREAESFERGNAVIAREGYGEGIGIVGDLGEHPTTWFELDWDVERAGTYAVEVRYAAQDSRPMRLSVDGLTLRADALAAVTGDWYPSGQRWHHQALCRLEAGRRVLRLESDGHLPHVDRLRLTLLDEGPSAPRSPERLAADLDLRPGLLRALTHAEPAELLTQEDARRSLEGDLGEAEREALEALRARRAELEAASPTPPTAMTVRDGEVGDLPLHRRGSHLDLGDPVPRGVLGIVGGPVGMPLEQSGRLELARWLVAPDNPLPARVLVNRLWRWHFGAGLAPSTSDFGVRGGEPSHPELLDHLAGQLRAEGWSWKQLHRLIVLSATYRQGTQGAPGVHEQDPANRLLARQSPVRLEAEAIRDSLLAVTGRLEHEVGGALLSVVSQNPSPQDLENNRAVYEGSRRRSIYLPVVRSNVYEMLALFDFPNASMSEGDRATTTVPTQALWMLNSPWVQELSDDLARQVSGLGPVDGVRQLYRRVLGRAPEPAERGRAAAYLAAAGDGGWSELVQVLFASNDFLYRN